MITKIMDPIRVAVVFSPEGALKPVWFDWKNRKHTISEMTYRWSDKRGDARLLHFAVKSECGFYELTYNTLEQTWQLATLETDV